ncbi:MAG: formyl transferase [Gemmatimonadaceae bacterium]
MHRYSAPVQAGLTGKGHRMKFVIATSDGLEHTYVTNVLAEALGVDLAAVIVERPARLGLTYSRLRKIRTRYSALRVAERVTTKLVRRLLRQRHRTDEALRRILGDAPLTLPAACAVLETLSINAKALTERIESIAPDVLLVFGTSVARARLLGAARQLALNLHTGISPFYRGSDTVFWPLYNGEPGMVGATVHQCTADLDGGMIYATIRVRLDPSDSVESAFAKSVREGAAAYADIARRLASAQGLDGHRQDLAAGQEYRFRDLTFVQELMMEWRLRTGVLSRAIAREQSDVAARP